jgi:Arc/MetJ family transcription regulator
MTGDGDLDTPYSCPVPDAPSRLAKLEPQNLFAWAALIDPPAVDQGQGGQLIWKYEHEPAARAQFRRLMAQAARATTWDAGSVALRGIQAKAYGVSYIPMHLQRIYFDHNQVETEYADGLRETQRATWFQAWALNGGGAWVFQRMCNPAVADVDEALRADCMRIFRVLAQSKDDFGVAFSGWVGLARLDREGTLRKQAYLRWRQLHWLREQQPWSRERDPLAGGRQFMRDFAEYGEWEANLREADRVGIAREPPPGWQPRIHVGPTPFPE